MVLPFPNEIWLVILHDLAKEGEYDTPERCRVVCRGFRPIAEECLLLNMKLKSTEEVERIKVEASSDDMRRWGGPMGVSIAGGNWNDGRRPIPHLATFASRLGGRWPSFATCRSPTSSVDSDAGPPRLCPPRLKRLHLSDVQFTQQPFEAFTISQFPLLSHMQLETLTLDSIPDVSVPALRASFVELVDFIASTSDSDVSLNKLVRPSGQSLHHLSLCLGQYKILPLLDGEALSPYSGSVPYFDVSENTYLEHLESTVHPDHKNGPYLWTPVFAVISRVTSTHISRISIFYSGLFHDASLDVCLGKLIEKLPQLDDILSRPVFDNLAHVNVYVSTPYGPDVRDEKWANDLRVCLAKLGERGILGSIRIGLHWDNETKSWKRYGAERDAAQDVKNSEVARVGDEGCASDADGHTISCNNSGAVLAALKVVSVSSADAETSSSSLSLNAQVAIELSRDHGIAQKGATTISDAYLSASAPEEQADE
ncbi:hypothetical protein POSPLADRAFT_1052643 [Postia placenta MAD-698-R-SB12]|uniref:F-box domain-containing protein n=1 Tax=Postia placenta MAD-698-R-SB12 TaxID=670580 RepID=A0A1X6NBN0_9APHY|nr:hypothetical protein POSPLADRAFT_1052643 [Postia placenta MAD-698-R-SB12]OSX65984.1 hypothetical protein POSPLADRAFT_1052643 [Postia placenta MAD-698-R-SB12]